MFDDLRKPEGDNPAIGTIDLIVKNKAGNHLIIRYTEKSETVVKHFGINDNPQIFATKFMPYLPTGEELIAEIDRNKIESTLISE